MDLLFFFKSKGDYANGGSGGFGFGGSGNVPILWGMWDRNG